TALMTAAYKSDMRTLSLLLAKGAPVNATNKSGWTALLYAAAFADPDCVKLLLQKGADVNLKTVEGFTTLMAAVQNDDREIVKLLIAAGADVNAVTTAEDNLKGMNLGWEKGQTALSMAERWQGQEEIVRLLKKAGAKK
ncbi:MAG: ankyrin repeat domain-containing protein, partial [Spirochaetia bacterium]